MSQVSATNVYKASATHLGSQPATYLIKMTGCKINWFYQKEPEERKKLFSVTKWKK